jgi:hypothetical protein
MKACVIGKDLRCSECGVAATSERVLRPCPFVVPARGLGDVVADSLDAIGVSKERVRKVFGNCGCQQRQEALNRLGRRLLNWLSTPSG